MCSYLSVTYTMKVKFKSWCPKNELEKMDRKYK